VSRGRVQPPEDDPQGWLFQQLLGGIASLYQDRRNQCRWTGYHATRDTRLPAESYLSERCLFAPVCSTMRLWLKRNIPLGYCYYSIIFQAWTDISSQSCDTNDCSDRGRAYYDIIFEERRSTCMLFFFSNSCSLDQCGISFGNASGYMPRTIFQPKAANLGRNHVSQALRRKSRC
jgi:hypothetical protein